MALISFHFSYSYEWRFKTLSRILKLKETDLLPSIKICTSHKVRGPLPTMIKITMYLPYPTWSHFSISVAPFPIGSTFLMAGENNCYQNVIITKVETNEWMFSTNKMINDYMKRILLAGKVKKPCLLAIFFSCNH